ncbi:MAG: DNA (cytosine-5-)-methyltransferase [Flavobacteriales bacterium]|nr:DNA (cytosine-5-)-methyltransferase [Flavobacteriales bacterium]MEB2342241.1 DNA (cytosine-5-)-methyltransferase [Flavobacteriia bacterium]
MDRIKVVELFAGVGGFRVGLGQASPRYRIVWSNQWEPSRKKQDASAIYVGRFGAEGHSNVDIATVDVRDIPDHDLLVGGFPCQDYSVARTLNQAEGLQGKKGVLWWEIHRILKGKRHKPGYILLENVDRLLKSPARQRGRDFAVMLASLADLGYVVEWRVINAADYGMPQRRRRVFFMGFHKTTPMGRALLQDGAQAGQWLSAKGIFAEAFPVRRPVPAPSAFTIDGDLADVSAHFNAGRTAAASPFRQAGILVGRTVRTMDVIPDHEGPFTVLGDVLLPAAEVPPEYYIGQRHLKQWGYLKGGKKEVRTNKSTGHVYNYAEGAMAFPDALDKPSRTIITAEGGPAPSRFKHVIRDEKGRLRRLTPVELERLNMFPDGHTRGIPDGRRAFLMGNALVVGIIKKAGEVLAARIAEGPVRGAG